MKSVSAACIATTTDGHHDDHGHGHAHVPHESPWVVTLPLVLLAIPSVIIGFIAIEPMLFGDFFKNVIFINHEAHPVMEELAHSSTAPVGMATHALAFPAVLAGAGRVATAWLFYMKPPDSGDQGQAGRHPPCWKTNTTSTTSTLACSPGLARPANPAVEGGRPAADRWPVGQRFGQGGRGRSRLWCASFQTGFIYHYATAMIVAFLVSDDLVFWPDRPLRMPTDTFRKTVRLGLWFEKIC